MKRWASLKSSASRKPKTMEEYKKKTVPKKEFVNLQGYESSTDPDAIRKSALIKQLKAYDALRIEAAQYERNARKLEMENALLENVRFAYLYLASPSLYRDKSSLLYFLSSLILPYLELRLPLTLCIGN